MSANKFGLSFDTQFDRERNAWFSMTDWTLHNSALRWLFFVHAVWLVINLLELFICGWLALRFHNERAGFLGLILLIPAAYYASYMIALTASEFRFMYPSLLIVQVVTLTYSACAAARGIGRLGDLKRRKPVV